MNLDSSHSASINNSRNEISNSNDVASASLNKSKRKSLKRKLNDKYFFINLEIM